MKKKVLALLLIVALVASLAVGLVACNDGDNGAQEIELPAYDVQEPDYSAVKTALASMPDFKIGMICLHDQASTYDKNFIQAMEEVEEFFGLSEGQVLYAYPIAESEECYEKAIEFANAGCDIIFADSFGHEEYMIKAAKEKPDVLFAHATGTMAHTENLPNFVNAFASIYEGRYLAGIAAGMKLNEMIAAGEFTAEEAKMGYVGAWTYAEVISGYTSFYLGAKSVCPTVTMDVTFTGSWYDETAEKQSAQALINSGCKLISQHADSMGAPNACEEAGVPNVSYNGSTFKACPDTFIVSSRINWAPYYKYLIASVVNGTPVAEDWVGTIQTGSVVLTNLGSASAEGTVEAIVEAREKLVAGTLNVFDTANFTATIVDLPSWENDVNTNAKVDATGKVTSYMADVDTDEFFTPDTEAVISGIFEESYHRSAPYFDLKIDGITLLNVKM